MPTPQQAADAQVQLEIQAELESIALQYQIRPGDLKVEWDGGTMEMVTATHDLHAQPGLPRDRASRSRRTDETRQVALPTEVRGGDC